MLFSDKRKHQISVPSTDSKGQSSNVAFLIGWLCDNLMKDPRKEMFVLDGSVYAINYLFSQYVVSFLWADWAQTARRSGPDQRYRLGA